MEFSVFPVSGAAPVIVDPLDGMLVGVGRIRLLGLKGEKKSQPPLPSTSDTPQANDGAEYDTTAGGGGEGEGVKSCLLFKASFHVVNEEGDWVM